VYVLNNLNLRYIAEFISRSWAIIVKRSVCFRHYPCVRRQNPSCTAGKFCSIYSGSLSVEFHIWSPELSHLDTLLDKNQHLLDELSRGKLVVFAGAGISRFVGMPSWEQLITPLASQLGIDPLDANILDIPQYYVTQNAQGRYLLNKHICESLTSKTIQFSPAHEFIKQLPTPVIITTNFDLLFEKTFDETPSVRYHKVIADDDLTYWDNQARLLIKMNGCISQPGSLVIARNDFWEYRTKRPALCDKLKSLMAESTFLFVGFSFRDPVFELLYAEVLNHLRDHRRPFYFVSLKSNRYEIDDKRAMGLQVLDLQVADLAHPDEVIKFLELLKSRCATTSAASLAPGSATVVVPSSAMRPSASSLLSTSSGIDLLAARLGTALSIQVNERHVDDIHHYDLIYRQDILDYSTQDFFSFRRLSGTNQSSMLSSFLLYSEASEQKLTFKQAGVTAVDLTTNADLIVECDGDPDSRRFAHAFRIYFPNPLAPGEAFDLAYCIRLPGELAVLSDRNEVMSISLARVKRGINKLHFNVCLNFKPKTFAVECLDWNNKRVVPSGPAPRMRKYLPTTNLEKRFNTPWSAQPFRIEWDQDKPEHMLYIINYRQ